MATNNRITPFVKRMRANGGTIYTFSSAIEDIGLNINERNNLVKISHFALLDIPNIAESSTGYINNTFNIRNIAGSWEYERNSTSIKDGRMLIAESFQNYALNLESNLLNQSTYNPELTTTVSERVFWKWMKETGSMRWIPDASASGTDYWIETLTTGTDYTSVVKYVGQVSAGNVRIDNFGTYNETYLLVPTSHGQTRAYFKQVKDDNYSSNFEIGNLGENILGREGYTKPHPDGLNIVAYYDYVDSSTELVGGANDYDLNYYDIATSTWKDGWWYTAQGLAPTSTDNAYLSDSSTGYIDASLWTELRYVPQGGGNNISFTRSNLDSISIETNLDQLKTLFSDSALTWDTMATEYFVNDAFNFNAVLIYYTVYNQTQDDILATNLLGVMFLDAPSGNSSNITTSGVGIQLPSLEKIMSAETGFGTSYSLRLNIKTDNMTDDTGATIVDQSTSDQLWAEEWQQAFQNLQNSVNILTQQNATINYISGQYTILQSNQTQLVGQVSGLQNDINDIGRDITGTAGTIPLFSDGDDSLIDSSIYMTQGRIGIFETSPQWGVHIDSSIKTLDITLENAIRDVSGNILLGYGSPLQIGSSTNYRNIDIYTGNEYPALSIDSSGVMDVSLNITGNIKLDGELLATESYVDASIIQRDSSITLLDTSKAPKDAPLFTTSFGMGDWTFDTSGTMLRLNYDGSTKFVFATDGSIFSN